MQTILLVSSNDKLEKFIDEIIPSSYYEELTTVKTCGEARRLLVERTFDLCIINSPLVDEEGDKLAINIVGEKANQVILIVKQEKIDEISESVEDYGVIAIGKPINRSAFWTVYKLAESSFKRLNAIQNENLKLKRMLADMKFVAQAKCLLIENEKMSEEQAHKTIEGLAMKERKTRGEVSKEIISKYKG